MSTDRSRRMTICIFVIGLSVLTLFPGELFGQVGQDGKWKVTSTSLHQFIYHNITGSSQKVMVTACSVSGGGVQVSLSSLSGTADTFDLNNPDCGTIATILPAGGVMIVALQSGTSASGTYQVSVLP